MAQKSRYFRFHNYKKKEGEISVEVGLSAINEDQSESVCLQLFNESKDGVITLDQKVISVTKAIKGGLFLGSNGEDEISAEIFWELAEDYGFDKPDLSWL